MMAWHQNALKGVYGDDINLHSEDPECGWFQTRLTEGGPFVPCRIWLHQDIDDATGELMDDEQYRCEVDDREVDVEAHWPWLCGSPISQQKWQYMVANREWARSHAPNEPAADGRKPVDWLKTPPPEF